jgi:hypothetical protein
MVNSVNVNLGASYRLVNIMAALGKLKVGLTIIGDDGKMNDNANYAGDNLIFRLIINGFFSYYR